MDKTKDTCIHVHYTVSISAQLMTAVKLGNWQILGDGSTKFCDKPANFFGGREGIIL